MRVRLPRSTRHAQALDATIVAVCNFNTLPRKATTIRPGFFSRAQAREVLGCTYHQVRGLQRKGVLVGEKDKHGAWWFSTAEITEARDYVTHSGKRTGGELLARAFELFEAGATHVRCVIVLRVTTAQLVAMRSEYEHAGWAFTAAEVGAVRAMLEDVALDASSPAQLVACIKQLCDQSKQLRRVRLSAGPR